MAKFGVELSIKEGRIEKGPILTPFTDPCWGMKMRFSHSSCRYRTMTKDSACSTATDPSTITINRDDSAFRATSFFMTSLHL